MGGIADAIGSGALDFGGKVSEMSYSCNEPISSQAAFDKAVNDTKSGANKAKPIDVVYNPLKGNGSANGIVNGSSSSETLFENFELTWGLLVGMVLFVLIFGVICLSKSKKSWKSKASDEKPQ